MAEVLERYPSAPLTLFTRFGVGSRDKLGFRGDQELKTVLARHLIFDLETVLRTLEQVERQQSELRLSPAEFATRDGLRVDCRSADEHRLMKLPGSVLLSAELVARRPSPVLLFDRDGSQAGAAALHLMSLGLKCHVLEGGLAAWSAWQPRFPAYRYGPAPCWVLPHWKQARFAVEAGASGEGDPSLVPFACRRLFRGPNYLAVLRDDWQDWPEFAERVFEWLPALHQHPFIERPEGEVAGKIRQVLAEVVQPRLNSHKGSVELVEYRQGVARIALGGGCQGCSSAAITVGEEIAADLWEAIPELAGVEDASDHLGGQQPHH
jgi:Fe-S cluster biogenesis protein NfuA